MAGVRVSDSATLSEKPSSPSLLLLQLLGKHLVGNEAKGAQRSLFRTWLKTCTAMGELVAENRVQKCCVTLAGQLCAVRAFASQCCVWCSSSQRKCFEGTYV